jgi:thiamine kinase-like enzyme
MPAPSVDVAALLPLLPEPLLGPVTHISPLTLGQSGARVYAVSTPRGEFVLRVQASRLDSASFTQQLRILRRAAEAGVAPAIVHVDEAALAVVSVRVAGMPVAGALGDPTRRAAVIASVIDQLRTLHALDPTRVAESDPVGFIRAAWDACRSRPAFPPWADAIGAQLEATAAMLANDSRRVVSHNDVNPHNVIWDGARAWLVDWEASGLLHPYYDLATFALFLRIDDDAALAIAARHDGAALDEPSREIFRALRRLGAVLSGLAFLRLVDDFTVRPSPTRADAPTLASCYEGMRAGQLDISAPKGRMTMGLALLAEAITISPG